MHKRNAPAIIGGLVFALVWFAITRDPLQAISTGIIFTMAWFAGRSLWRGRGTEDRPSRR